MLHRLPPPHCWGSRIVKGALTAALAGLLVSAGVPTAGAAEPDGGALPDATAPGPGPFDDPFTAAARQHLRQQIRPCTVIVRRRGALPSGMWSPGGGVVEVHGWWARAGRVVTAAVAVEGWPMSARDQLEVESSDGRRFAAAVGLTESALGLAVLDVPGLPEPARRSPAGGPDASVRPGRPLYAADGSDLLHRLVVHRRAEGQLAYYWRTLGRLAVGTPLFDARGRVVSFIGREGPEPSIGLALPAKALRALLERDDWVP